MLRHLAEFQDELPTTLIFAANREEELFAAEAIGALAAALPMLTVVLSVWRPQGAWSGFTGTAAEIIPVINVDDRPIGTGKPGRFTRSLIKAFRELTQTEGASIYGKSNLRTRPIKV